LGFAGSVVTSLTAGGRMLVVVPPDGFSARGGRSGVAIRRQDLAEDGTSAFAWVA